MPLNVSPALRRGVASSPQTVKPHRRALVVAWGALAVLLLVHLPAFLCMGLDSDISLYDVIARRVLRGDVPYRDLLETNFPGMVWLHMAARSWLGWRSETLRAVDFAVVSACAWLLTEWLPRSCPAWRRVALAGVLLAFYLSTSEWCHCQRDTWMLLPALLALRLRVAQTERIADRRAAGAGVLGWGVLEGMIWGAGFWIKPFVAAPAAACWLVAGWRAGGAGSRPATTGRGKDSPPTAPTGRRLAVDFLGLLAGGLVVGGIGVAWLVARGAWPAFVEVMFVWNREYFAFNVLGDEPWAPLLGFFARLFPWVLVHLAAVPMALAMIWRSRRCVSERSTPLLAAFYLAWLGQAIALQHLFDYVHAPAILLGLAVMWIAAASPSERRSVARAEVTGKTSAASRGLGSYATGFTLLCLAWCYPALCAQRVPAWSPCLTEGSTAAVRDRLTLLHRVHWTNLSQAADCLRAQRVADCELTSLSLPTVALYGDLDLRPSTRYVLLQDHLDIFARRRPAISAALVDGRQKYLVCDLGRYNMRRVREAVDAVESDATNADAREKEAMERGATRPVFRAGDYVVFRLDGPEMPAWLAEHLAK